MTDQERVRESIAYLRRRVSELCVIQPTSEEGARGLQGAIAELIQCIRQLGGDA